MKDPIEAYVASGKGSIDHVFADYNAGRFSSRNAALQDVVNRLAGGKKKLTSDGDMLIYLHNGSPSDDASKTEELVQDLADEFDLGLSNEQIRADLLKEKMPAFENTLTYQKLRATYKNQFGNEAAYARIPEATVAGAKEKMGRETSVRSYVKTSRKFYDELHDYIG